MKKVLYSIIAILFCFTSLLKAQKKNTLEIGIGTSMMSEVLLKKGFRFEAEYSRYFGKRAGLLLNLNVNYGSGVGFDFTTRAGESGFYAIGKDIPSAVMESIRSNPLQTFPAHTLQVFHATVVANAYIALMQKKQDELIIMAGGLVTYSSKTQIQEDAYIYKSESFPQIQGIVKVVVPHYSRYVDAGFDMGIKYKHYFKNDFSVGARAAMEYAEGWGIFSLTATCGVRF
jgi:hypothetical protein